MCTSVVVTVNCVQWSVAGGVQQEFQRNRDQVEGAEEEFEKYCAEAMFRIGILEQRLQRQVSLIPPSSSTRGNFATCLCW